MTIICNSCSNKPIHIGYCFQVINQFFIVLGIQIVFIICCLTMQQSLYFTNVLKAILDPKRMNTFKVLIKENLMVSTSL